MSFRQPTTIHGVDFGVGASDAGRSTWLTTIQTTPELRVTDCQPATERLGCDPDREATLAALRSWVAELDRSAAVGFDFPFGLPARLLDPAIDDWRATLAWFAERCESGAFDGPDALSSWGTERAREVTDGQRAYLPRETDRAHDAQCAYGFIGKYPTFYGLRDLLVPLVFDRSAVTVCPTMPDRDRPLVLETYPATIHETRGEHRESYKEPTDEARARRVANRDALAANVGCVLPDHAAARMAADADGDAVDSFAAAVAAFANTRDPAGLRPSDASPRERLEARIYA